MSIFENDVISEREFYVNTVKLVCLENTMLPKYAKDRTYRDINLWEYIRGGIRKSNTIGAIMQGKNALYLLDLSKGIKIDIKYKFYNFTYSTAHRGKIFIYQSDYYKTRELLEAETEFCELKRTANCSRSFIQEPLRQNVTIVGNIIGEDIFGMSFSINNVTLNLVNVLVAKGMNDITWNITDSGNYVPYIFPSK